jgi:hypothetical protein
VKGEAGRTVPGDNDDEKNTMGLSNTVTAVTAVTIDNTKDEIGIILKEKGNSTALSEGIHNSLGNTEEKETFECYYCHDFLSTYDNKEYEKHVVLEHPKKNAYPGLIDMEKNSLIPKGNSWEI